MRTRTILETLPIKVTRTISVSKTETESKSKYICLNCNSEETIEITGFKFCPFCGKRFSMLI